MKTIKLNNWSVVYVGDEYTAPELIQPRLNGDAQDHPTMGTQNITTSAIQKIENSLVYTNNHVYELGTPHPDYEKAFPNAKERFFSDNKKNKVP